ncbi:MYXO-CTERM sorting domain-containing protein [Achromobacter sp. AONIH1]
MICLSSRSAAGAWGWGGLLLMVLGRPVRRRRSASIPPA